MQDCQTQVGNTLQVKYAHTVSGLFQNESFSDCLPTTVVNLQTFRRQQSIKLIENKELKHRKAASEINKNHVQQSLPLNLTAKSEKRVSDSQHG